MKWTPTDDCIVFYVEIFEGALDDLFKYILTLLKIDKLTLASFFDAFKKNCTSVCLKPSRRKGALIFNTFSSVLKTIADGE